MLVKSPIAAGATLALFLLASAPHSRAAGPKTHVVEISNLAYGPAPRDLHVNDIVEWRNSDIFRHTATAPDGSFDLDLPPGAAIAAVMRKAGGLDYFCRFHPGMKGRLEVAP